MVTPPHKTCIRCCVRGTQLHTTVARLASVRVPPHSIHHSGTAGQCPFPAQQHSPQWHGWPVSVSRPTAFTPVARLASVRVPPHSIHPSGTAGQRPCPAPQHSPQWHGWQVSRSCPKHSPQWHGWQVSVFRPTAFTSHWHAV